MTSRMDFVEGLHKSHMQDVIFVVVEKLTKYVHFIPLAYSYSAAKVICLTCLEIIWHAYFHY